MARTKFGADISCDSKDITIYDQIEKWRTGRSPNRDGINRDRHRDQNSLTNISKVLTKTSDFSNLATHRWHCSQIWHGPPVRDVDDTY